MIASTLGRTSNYTRVHLLSQRPKKVSVDAVK